MTQEKHHNKLFPRTLEFKQKTLQPLEDGAKANTPAAGSGGGHGGPRRRQGMGTGMGWDEDGLAPMSGLKLDPGGCGMGLDGGSRDEE